MTTISPSAKNLPLPVRIFHTAMAQQLSLADYAQRIGVSSDSLQAIVSAPLDQVEPAILEQLAQVYGQPREALSDPMSIAAPQESFAAWLKRNMEGISQHALRARVQLDAKTLKRFLNAGQLPDSDQAERLARALYVDRAELARVVIGSMMHQVAAEHPSAAASPDQAPAAPTSAGAPINARPRRTRPQNMTSDTDTARTQAAVASEAAPAEPALEAGLQRRSAARRQVEPKAINGAGEQESMHEAEQAARPAARARTSTKSVAPRPDASAAAHDARDAEDAARQTVARATPAAAPTAEATADVIAPAAVKQPRQRPAQRQAGAAASHEETAGADPDGALTAELAAATSASPSATVAEIEAPGRRTIRTQRRAKPAPAPDPATAEVGLGDASEAPSKPAPELDAVPSQASPAGEDHSSIAGAVAPQAAPEAMQKPRAQAKSTSTAPERATVASILAAGTERLELTPDEVRLIRHWRRLHPHGRRATLHYIGSLLVDE